MSGASPRRTGRTPYRDLSPGRRAGSRRRPASPRRGSGSRSPSASPVDTAESAHLRAGLRVERVDVSGIFKRTRSSSRRAATSKLLGRTAHRSLTRKSASSSIAVMFSISAVRDMVEISGSPYICVVSAVCARNARPLAIFLIASMQLYISWSAVTPSAPRNRFVRERERARMPIVAADDTDSRERGMDARHTSARGWPNGLTRPEVASVADSRSAQPRGETQDPGATPRSRSTSLASRPRRRSTSPRRPSGSSRRPTTPTSPGVVVADIDVAGDPSDLSASALPFLRAPRAPHRFPPTWRTSPDARSGTASRSTRRSHRRRSRLPPRGVRIRRGDEYGGRRRARPDRRARGGRRPRSVRRLTVERISYRGFDRCGTPRDVDIESVFAAADRGYPTVWDTVDRGRARRSASPTPRTDLTRDPRGRRQRVSRDRRGDRL